MAVATQFHNWQSSPMQPNPSRCSPFLVNLRDWLIHNWGGQNLGCWADRPVREGTSPSSHASGAALDWRYENPGIGRARMLNEIMPTLLNMSAELAVNAVHDYAGMRIWRPPGTSGRPTSPSPECGWRPNSGSNMNPSSLWLHIEVLNTRWSDTTPIDQLLAGGGPTPTPPPTEEEPVYIVRDPAGRIRVGNNINQVVYPNDADAAVPWAINIAVRVGRPLLSFDDSRSQEVRSVADILNVSDAGARSLGRGGT